MGKETYLAHTITQTDYEARYDRAAKKLLANRLVLAHILKECVREYQDCSIMDIAQKYIEGEPEVGTTGVYMDDSNSPEQPDIKPEAMRTQATGVQATNTQAIKAQMMNTQPMKVQGVSNEDISQNEGTVYYDVRFNAIAPSTGEHENIRLIINAEAQNRFKLKYPLTKRAVYYGSRLISAQHGTVFTKSNYQKLRKVYSIWICVNPTKKFRNTITRYSLKPENIVGNAVEAPENYDLINIVMVCLGKMEEWNDNNLIKFLGVLFQNELSAREKKDILERDFDIPMTETFESEVDDMCNLSQGVAEEAMQKGIEKGRQEGIQKGIEQGRQEGIQKGIEQGRQEGMQNGIVQGIEQGIQQGIQQGRTHALVELVNDGAISIEKAAEKASMSVEEFRNAMKSANTQN